MTLDLTELEVDLLQGLVATNLAYILRTQDTDDPHVRTVFDLFTAVGNKLGMDL